MLAYEPYHVHTCYSNCLTQPDSTMFISDYAKAYKERGHHVLCISEHGNRSNVWEQYEIAEKYRNDKDDPYDLTPLAAAEVYFVPDRFREIDGKKDGRNFHLILVAKDQEGFYQLNEALSEANLTGFYGKARVDFDILGRLDYKHFLCTTACVAGIMRDQLYENYACTLHEIFRENFYLEIQDHPQAIQVETNQKVLRLYGKYHWPLIFGTDSHYIYPEEAALRKELLLSAKINYGDEDSFILDLPTAETAYQRLLDQGVFVKARIEEAMENTLFLREFEGVKFDRERKFPISRPELTQEQRNRLYKHMVCNGYIEQAGMPTKEEAAEIHKEMDTIVETNSADYFIGLHDMLELGKKKGGVLTTTSRGSACGFVSNYSLKFTSINRLHVPVRMYPARFISKAKLLSGSMPDIDSNLTNVEAFEEAGKEIFGEWGCLPMIAFGTVRTLSAFKMLARARDLDFETSNEVSKQIQNYEADVKYAKENNQDDPDYDVNDDVQIDSYVEDKYLDLIEDSKKYLGIVTSVSPHPCGHIVYHKDLRREIGVVRVKSKSGNKDAVYAAYIDGIFADKFGWCKSDMLRVDVVKIISDTFKEIGQPVLTADELVEKTKDDPKVWNILADGFTMGCNQTERPKTTQRVMQFKPKNTVELAAFIAAIRPGAKSLVNYLVTRTPHVYNIPAMDKLLKLDGATGVTGESSFLLYDEQIMQLAEAAGIPAEDTNALIKHIKKKHHKEVEQFKEDFVPGFVKYLTETEHVEKELAEKTAKDVWTVILNSASYLFNLSHAYAMNLDCLYGMYLKAYYPYEFYKVLLKLYDEKKNTEKISAIIAEMKRYAGIKLLPGKWGQDNRDWLVDKDNKTISQSLSSIRYMSKQVAQDLFDLSSRLDAYIGTTNIPAKLNKEGKALEKALKEEVKATQKIAETMSEEEINRKNAEFDRRREAIWNNENNLEQKAQTIEQTILLTDFSSVLRAIQMNTCLDARQIKILIELGYFNMFGGSGKLMKVYNEFFEGPNKLTKTTKSFASRLDKLREFENSLQDEELPIRERLQSEQENIGLCLSTQPDASRDTYFVRAVDAKWKTTVTLYSISSGASGNVRFRKADVEKVPVVPNQLIKIIEGNRTPRYVFKGGKRTQIPGEKEYWVKSYSILRTA